MDNEQREYHRRYYHKRRQRLLDYLGGKCVECGATDNLQFDHIDPSKKLFEISGRLSLKPEVKEELDKCQLLCKDHHQSKTAQENRGFRHGTMYGWMKRHCACDECTSAQAAWHKARNEQRRRDR